MLTWFHKSFVKPLCRPADSLKGHISYTEWKYFNQFIIYSSFCGTLPWYLIGYLLNYISRESFLPILVTYAILVILIKLRSQKTLKLFLLSTIYFMVVASWMSPDRMEAYFAPFSGMVFIWNVEASKKSLVIYTLFVISMSFYFVNSRIEDFVINNSNEELAGAIRRSFLMMVINFSSMFSHIIMRMHIQDKIKAKWMKLKMKIAEQNEILKKSNEDLKKALEDRETFILSFSHETRNPLNGLLGNLHILMDMPLSPDIRQMLNKVNVCAKILKNILMTILDSRKSGLSTEDMSLLPVSVDTKSFIHEIWMLSKDLIESKRLISILGISPRFPKNLVFDPERIAQVIINLVSNAIKFTQEGSIKLSFEWIAPNDRNRIELQHTKFYTSVDVKFEDRFGRRSNDYGLDWFSERTAQEDGELIISVEDTGCGIDRQKQATIFEKFSQVNSSPQLRRLGLGLGLWISKKIVDLHKGKILIDSEVGSGSCFSAVIPTIATPSVMNSNAEIVSKKENDSAVDNHNLHFSNHEHQQKRKSDLKALVVEDFPINQTINAEMLKKYGFQEVLIASNGQEGVSIFKEKGANYFDLITMDLEMPVMNGKEAIKQIRKWEQSMGILPCKIIVISGNAIEKEIQECTDPLGTIRADEFLAKPCDYSKLAKTIDTLIIKIPVSKKACRVKILFAEDDFFNLDMLESFCRKLDVDYLSARNGKEAVALFEKHFESIRIVLLDYHMPIMNGNEACQAMRQIIKKQKTNCSIYLLTGVEENQKAGSFAGIFNGIIHKPFNYQTFEGILKPIL